LQTWHDLTRSEDADLELVIRHLSHALGDVFRAPEKRIKALGEARGHPPFELGRALGDGRCSNRGGGEAEPARFEQFATLHEISSLASSLGRIGAASLLLTIHACGIAT